MKRLYKILRTVFVVAFILALAVPACLYVALSMPSVQRGICRVAEHELSNLLAVDVDIDYVSITPFNRVTLHGVTVGGNSGDTIMTVNRLGAGVSLGNLLFRHRMVFTYAEVIGLDARIYRDSIGSPLNIQPIIDALSPKDKTKPPTAFDFRVNTVVIRTSSVSYDVLSAPVLGPGVFDKNHVHISRVRADAQLPAMRNDDFSILLRRLAFYEQSGFTLNELSGNFHVCDTASVISGMRISLPGSDLRFGDITTKYKSLKTIGKQLADMPFRFEIASESYVTPADIAPFVPALKNAGMRVDVNLSAAGSVGDFDVDNLSVKCGDALSVAANGSISHVLNPDSLELDFPDISVSANGAGAAELVSGFVRMSEPVNAMLANAGQVKVTAGAMGNLSKGSVTLDLSSDCADAGVDVAYELVKSRTNRVHIEGKTGIAKLKGDVLFARTGLAMSDITELEAEVDFSGYVGSGIPSGDAGVLISQLEYRGHRYTDVTARIESESDFVDVVMNVDNPGVMFDVNAHADIAGAVKGIEAEISARDVDLALLDVKGARPGYLLSGYVDANLEGSCLDDLTGHVHIHDLDYSGRNADGLKINLVSVESTRRDSVATLMVESDIVDGVVIGRYSLSSLPSACKSIVSDVMPQLLGVEPVADAGKKVPEKKEVSNELQFDFTIKDSSPLENLVKIPVRVIYPVKITGGMSSDARAMSVNVDAPFLQQGNRLIENTSLSAIVRAPLSDGMPGDANVEFTTVMPTKKGAMTLLLSAVADGDAVDSRLKWNVNREREFSGDINLSARFDRDEQHRLLTDIDVNPGKMVFNDTVWSVSPSEISIYGNEAEVRNFRVGRQGQFVTIDGRASKEPSDTLTLTLEDVNLDYVFETLDVSSAMFGGNATGVFYATDLFTSSPRAITPGLSVRNLTYNSALLGNANILSEWRPETKAVWLNAEIRQANGRKSYVDGEIKPMADSLDLKFDADKLNVGFLQYFMSAFATEVSGQATGKARLWGSFKNIDMTGDVLAEDVRIKIGFTNTAYTTTDTVRLRPGRIDLSDIVLHDEFGNSAKLNGYLTHKYFKDPVFNFAVTDARNLLVYDVKEGSDSKWFGHVFGNGGVNISGRPGVVDIGVNMSTAPNSSFSFVLSDELNAQEYNFLTFRDRDRAKNDSIAAATAPPVIVRELKAKMAAGNAATVKSDYRLNIDVDVTPQAQVNLIMDPVGGDRIRAYGRGNMRLTYESANEDLKMNGTYTVERGNYNFTLQEIIIKDFTIKEGSSIAFHGDPYAADLDIKATYAVNANLSDLDESFLADKDLNRTNVPVHALLIVTGDMRSPDISFDLEFPTLTQDTYRKVRSIVNTEDMMNRQIIYLLALNRFYTPDYMTATKGNELVSVASSTISSQLGNMLGQLSDNWNIAPNFRSDKGDFSDVEVDLALSSHLLNNRLLLNGNFGYRDKTLNNNSFIGDFDIEYLLNRSGSIRLKAYNRYNDQNFYVKSALTTQGVGIVFKRDFDSVTSWLRPLRRKWRHNAESADTVPAAGGQTED